MMKRMGVVLSENVLYNIEVEKDVSYIKFHFYYIFLNLRFYV